MSNNEPTPTVSYPTPDHDGQEIIVVVAAPTEPEQKPDTSQGR